MTKSGGYLMLAPDDLDAVLRSLKTIYAEMLWADQLVTAGRCFQVFDNHQETAWASTLRAHISLLAEDAEHWLDIKPSTASKPFSTFLTYTNAFSAASEALQSGVSKDVAVQTMDRLNTVANNCVVESRTARLQFEQWVNEATVHTRDVEDSIQESWAALGSTERKVVDLAERIVQVQDHLQTLSGVVAPDQLSSQTLDGLSTIFVNTASLVYNVAIAGLPIPYLSVAATFFTLGKLFYTIFSTNDQIQAEIEALGKYRLDLNQTQLALAQTKAVLCSLYDMRQLLASQRSSLMAIETFWSNEVRNITTVRNKFALMESISTNDPEIQQLPAAVVTWDILKNSAQSLLSNFSRGADSRTVISITI